MSKQVSCTMSKKQSAYQVYSENPGSKRHAAPTRSSAHNSGATRGDEVWRVEDTRIDHQPRRRSPSPDLRRDQSYNVYSGRRDDGQCYTRETLNDRSQTTSSHKGNQSSYNDDPYNRHSWSPDNGRKYDMDSSNRLKDTLDSSNRLRNLESSSSLRLRDSIDSSSRLKDTTDSTRRLKNIVDSSRLTDARHSYSSDESGSNYLRAKHVPTTKRIRVSRQETDSDDECLHESLRPKKDTYLEADQRGWSSDDDDYNNRPRKRSLSEDDYPNPNPIPAKVWKERRSYSSEEDHQNTKRYSDNYDVHPAVPASPLKKKKMTRKLKGKAKKQKLGAVAKAPPAPKIQSLMDIQIPSRVKQQVEQCTANSAALGQGTARYSDKGPKYNLEEKGRSRYMDDDRSKGRSKFNDESYRTKPLNDGRRRLSGFDRRGYRNCDDGVPRETERGRLSRDNTDGSLQKRKQHGSGMSRMSIRPSQKDRSPVRSASDSDQDSDREGGRRSWRDERRDQQLEKSSNDNLNDQDRKKDGRGKNQKGDTLSKSHKKSESKSKNTKVDRNKSRGVNKDRKSRGGSKDKEGNRDKPLVRAAKQVKAKLSSVEVKPAPSSTTRPRLRVIPCKDGLAVLMVHPVQVYLRGRCTVKMLAGEVDIMGYTLRANPQGAAQEYDLFSPTTTSHLTITTVLAQTKPQLLKALKDMGLEDKALKDLLKEDNNGVLLHASKLCYPVADFLSSLAPFTQIFRYNFDKAPHLLPSLLGPGSGSAAPSATSQPDADGVGAAFMMCDSGTPSSLRTTRSFEAALSEWKAAVKDGQPPPVVVLCGGVNSGKSTLSRYMINTTLSVVSKVGYFDCDVGQTEFTPPGTVALTIVEEPIFGPPYCHQRRAESMCFYGNTSPADNPDHYIQCLQHVFRSYRKVDPPLPLIVNTMGWNQDAGLRLFVDILHLTTPDLVIQINVANNSLNFPEITPQFPVIEVGWTYNTDPMGEEFDLNQKKHELVTVESLVPTRTDLLKLTAKNLRDLTLLSHLMQGLPTGSTLVSARAKLFPWSQMAFHVCCEGADGSSPADQGPADNICGSVIALCHSDLSQAIRVSGDSPLSFLHPPVCECFGYGFVRGVSQKDVCIYVVTAVSKDQLNKVNTLLKGSVTLPDQFLLKQSSLDGVSYVGALEPTLVTPAHRPRARMPRRN